MRPDRHPAGAVVSLEMWTSSSGEVFQLGARSSAHFLTMLQQTPIHTQISQMPAAPLGSFIVGNSEYYWHGNAVIRGKGRSEKLWHGTYLQGLINEMRQAGIGTHDRPAIQTILDKLESDPHLESVVVEGPGAYPGGRDALHPVTFDDSSGWTIAHPDPDPSN